MNTTPVSAECVETKCNDELSVQTESSEMKNNSVHVGTKNKTGNVETDTTEQSSQHVEIPSVLHVVMTDSTPTSTENAAVLESTVDKVELVTSKNNAEKAPPAPVPPQDTKKTVSQPYRNVS